MSLERGAADNFYVCPGVGRPEGGMEVLNQVGRGRGKRVVVLASVVVCYGPCPRCSVTVRSERCPHALGFTSPAPGFSPRRNGR